MYRVFASLSRGSSGHPRGRSRALGHESDYDLLRDLENRPDLSLQLSKSARSSRTPRDAQQEHLPALQLSRSNSPTAILVYSRCVAGREASSMRLQVSTRSRAFEVQLGNPRGDPAVSRQEPEAQGAHTAGSCRGARGRAATRTVRDDLRAGRTRDEQVCALDRVEIVLGVSGCVTDFLRRPASVEGVL